MCHRQLLWKQSADPSNLERSRRGFDLSALTREDVKWAMLLFVRVEGSAIDARSDNDKSD
jgi:hypothetical protein